MSIVLNPDVWALRMRRTTPVHDSKPVPPEIPPKANPYGGASAEQDELSPPPAR